MLSHKYGHILSRFKSLFIIGYFDEALHNSGSMGFKRQDVFEGLQHVFPASYTHEEKLRKIGRLLGIMAKDGLIGKPSKGKKWNITEKGESELGA